MNPQPPCPPKLPREGGSTLNHYTASQLARAAGLSKVSMVRHLAGIPSRGAVIVHGNAASAWSVDDLPPHCRAAIAEGAQSRGCRNVHDFITQAPAVWQPAIPLPEVAPEAVDKAAKLRRALAHVLQLRLDPNVSGADLERLGLADFKKEFGYSITARTLRNLLRRTVERDNLADNFNRLDIYVDGNAPRAAVTPPAVLAQSGDYRVIYDCLAAFQDPQHPRPRELEDLWDKIIIFHQSRVFAGVPEKQSRFELLNVLWNSGCRLAKTRNALRVRFQYHVAHGVKPDGRHARKGIPVKPPVSRARMDDVQAYAVFGCNGRIAQAVREVDEFAEHQGIGEELAGALLGKLSRRAAGVQTPAPLAVDSAGLPGSSFTAQAGGRGLAPAATGPRAVEIREEVFA